MTLNSKRPLALIILDGWGVSPDRGGNAIALAHTPYYDEIRERFPSTTLAVSGVSVGLPAGEPGNAEIGHRIIGAGRAVQTEAARIASAVATGKFLTDERLRPAIAKAAAERRAIHFIGLLGDGGVHSSQETLFALLRMAKLAGASNAFVHAILDGRDVRPRTADVYVDALEIKMADIGLGTVASLCGRFYGMDTSEHWERTARAYTMLVHGEGERGFDAVTAIRASFLRGISDEFISPIVIETRADEPVATIKDGDLVIFFNHRADGMRQLVRSLAVPDPASPKPRVETVCMTEYDPAFGLPVAFEQVNGGSFLSDIFDLRRIKNYRITETSRAAHLSTIFNGRSSANTDLERRVFLQTAGPETLETDPESKSFKITDTVIRGLNTVGEGVFIMNLPAAALLAETGNFDKTAESVQFVDTCLGGVIEKVIEMNGVAVVTASHSGCESIAARNGSRNEPAPVPFHVIDPENTHKRLASGGSLADVAPTMLGILGIEQPPEMTGRDLRTL